MNMRLVVSNVVFAWFFLGMWCIPAYGDGGTLRMSGMKNGFLITVFTAPTPFRSGPVDISVLVQDALTGAPMAQTPVTVHMTKAGQDRLEHPATSEAATNKLLRAAQFELPEPGVWEIEVQVEGLHGPAVLRCELEAAAPLPKWLEMWPWICWPAVAIALFVIGQGLVRQRSATVGPSSH
jgi:hypothetical protein